MKKIAIFVSHRNDTESVILQNPLFIPIKCGAFALDESECPMLRDDSGENISRKKDFYSELTVQYWAWKNCDADYYGLCHYRRYFSFSKTEFEGDVVLHNQVVEDRASSFAFSKYGLLDEENIRREVELVDITIPRPWDVRDFSGPKGFAKTVYEMWKAHEGILIQEGSLDKLLEVVAEIQPRYTAAAKKYLEGHMAYSFNCHVMKKKYFFEFCEFEFSILTELEKKLDLSQEGTTTSRTLGYIAETILGIFITYCLTNPQIHISERQVVYFKNTASNPKIINRGECPLVVTCSDFYVPYLSAFIVSLNKSISRDKNYKIIVLNKNISENSKKIITKQCAVIPNVSIVFYQPFEELEGQVFHTANAVEESNYRLLAPWVLKEFDKAIILDLDVVFKEDIAKLYDCITFDDGLLLYAAKDLVYQGLLNGIDPDCMRYSLDVMGMKKPYNYVNTGVMVFNLKGMREFTTKSKLLDFSVKHHFRIQEQDLINVFYEGLIGFLDLKWNLYLETNSWVTLCINTAPITESKLYRQAQKQPAVLHYANVPKPWDAPGSVLSEEFWQNARECPYYEVILSRLVFNSIKATQSSHSDMGWVSRICPQGSLRRKVAIWCFPKDSLRRKIVRKLLNLH